MALIKSLNGIAPRWGNHCYFSENTTVIGDVIIGDECSFWFHSVIRGDVNYIRIGNRVNIQDGAIIHVSYKTAPCLIGNNVSIGHNAVIHGCTIHDDVLVGMGAIIMDHAVIQSHSLIAAGSLVLENTIVEPESIYGGIPAKKIGDITPVLREKIKRAAENYLLYKQWYEK